MKIFIHLMRLKKALKLSFSLLVSFPLSFFIGNELLANHLSDRSDYELYNDNLLACGGGGGGFSPAAYMKKKSAKLSFKKEHCLKLQLQEKILLSWQLKSQNWKHS